MWVEVCEVLRWRLIGRRIMRLLCMERRSFRTHSSQPGLCVSRVCACLRTSFVDRCYASFLRFLRGGGSEMCSEMCDGHG